MDMIFTKSFATSQEEIVRSSVVAERVSFIPGGLGNGKVTTLEKRLLNPLVFFCTAVNCGGNCVALPVADAPVNSCFLPNPDPFNSCFINNPGDIELLFQIGISDANNCGGYEVIPQTDTCYAVSPSGRSWGIYDTGDTF